VSNCTFEQVIDCSERTAFECSDRLLVALGHGADFKLRADEANDVVHGSVSILHNPLPEAHEVTVEMYDAGEDPCADHQTTLRCPDNMPSASELKQRAQNGWEAGRSGIPTPALKGD
jgi:hypothetical protein